MFGAALWALWVISEGIIGESAGAMHVLRSRGNSAAGKYAN